jgi:hypothetical protein
MHLPSATRYAPGGKRQKETTSMSGKTRTFTAGLAAAMFAVSAYAAQTHSLSGPLEKYDPAANTITITSPTGKPQTLTLAPNAQIHSGKATLAAKDLAPEVGHQVRVQYTEAGGHKMAQSVAIQAATPRATVKK